MDLFYNSTISSAHGVRFVQATCPEANNCWLDGSTDYTFNVRKGVGAYNHSWTASFKSATDVSLVLAPGKRVFTASIDARFPQRPALFYQKGYKYAFIDNEQ